MDRVTVISCQDIRARNNNNRPHLSSSSDGCEVDTSSDNGITLEWPEVSIGRLVEMQCPCELPLERDISLTATRLCGGDFIAGGEWEEPEKSQCDLSDFAKSLCSQPNVCPCFQQY